MQRIDVPWQSILISTAIVTAFTVGGTFVARVLEASAGAVG
jgi:hypothetical protein